ncbi:MAG: DNA-3-methyladenine glycosylase 2 family protein [Pseudomonadales bacterium]|nr:DNA-3-methyladenine glycosylase 2 family protein [Pseudomonadales bacterium]
MRRHLRAADPVMGQLLRVAGKFTLEPQLTHTPFWSLARAIANQQLNGTAAATILRRFADLYPDHEFPAPELVLATDVERLRGIGFSYAKVAALHDLADKTISGVVPVSQTLRSLDDAQIIARLTGVRGIGRWTVEMLLMFQLGRPDVLPVDDFGVRNGFRLAYGIKHMPTPRALGEFGARWAPYRTMAAWYLWRAVELEKRGKLPPPPVRTRIAGRQAKRRSASRVS